MKFFDSLIRETETLLASSSRKGFPRTSPWKDAEQNQMILLRDTAFEVEGQCGENGSGEGSATIDKDLRIVSLFVCDTVDVKKLKVKRIELKSETKNPDAPLGHRKDTGSHSAWHNAARACPKAGGPCAGKRAAPR